MYSRATTSEIADRDFLGAVVFFGCVFGLSLAIVTVLWINVSNPPVGSLDLMEV